MNAHKKKKPYGPYVSLKINLEEIDGLPINEEFHSIDNMVKWIIQYLNDGGGR